MKEIIINFYEKIYEIFYEDNKPLVNPRFMNFFFGFLGGIIVLSLNSKGFIGWSLLLAILIYIFNKIYIYFFCYSDVEEIIVTQLQHEPDEEYLRRLDEIINQRKEGS